MLNNIQEDLLDNIEITRHWIRELQDDVFKDVTPTMNSFYRGQIAAYKNKLATLEGLYKRYFKHDLELLQESQKNYPILAED